MELSRNDIILLAFVVLEMAWAAFMIYRPTHAAEPVVITKTNKIEIHDEPIEHIENITVSVEEAIKPELVMDYGEREIIARLVNAEAKGEDMIGKRLIVDVILNRVEAEGFPNDVEGVIYEPRQFTTPAAGYTDEDMEAVELELFKRLDHNVVYFRTGRYHSIGKKLYIHGSHYFSGKEIKP